MYFAFPFNSRKPCISTTLPIQYLRETDRADVYSSRLTPMTGMGGGETFSSASSQTLRQSSASLFKRSDTLINGQPLASFSSELGFCLPLDHSARRVSAYKLGLERASAYNRYKRMHRKACFPDT